MATPRKVSDPEGDKRRALKFAAVIARNATKPESAKHNAIRFAADVGASPREISDATGIPHLTVERIVERSSRTA